MLSRSVMSDSLRPMDYIVHGILQARILEWVALPFFRGSSQPRDQTQVSHIAGRFFTSWATRDAYFYYFYFLAIMSNVAMNILFLEYLQTILQAENWMCFPDSSVGKESACNAGDPGSILGLERSAGEGISYPLQYSWASLVAQLVKNLPAMQETLVRFLG